MEDLVRAVVEECLTEHLYTVEDYGKRTRRVCTSREVYIDPKGKLFFRVKVECDMVKPTDKGQETTHTIRYYDYFELRELAKKNRLALEEIMIKFGHKISGLGNFYYLVFDKDKTIEQSETEYFDLSSSSSSSPSPCPK